jgi:antitoxin component YwqK of YwqJK toxin-antitoxin module
MGKVILTISVIFIGLSSYGQTNQDIYKLSDYVLVRTDSTSRGLDRKFYVYRYDTARRMLVEYYYDGTILGRSFSYEGKLEGNLETFGANGRPIAISSFHNGVKVSTRYLIPRDTTSIKFFSNGKLRPLKDGDVDSLLKK